MTINYIANGNPSNGCSYVVAAVNWKCKPAGDKVLWSGIANAIAIDVTGYNTDTPGASTAAPTTSGCTYAGPSSGFNTTPKTYPSGGGTDIPAIQYTPRTCGDYNITAATNATTAEAPVSTTVTNSGKFGEVTRIQFNHARRVRRTGAPAGEGRCPRG